MSDDELVTIQRVHDPVQASLLKERLEDEGIVVATPGLEHRSMLGMLGSYVDIAIQVRRGDAAQAEAILEAYSPAIRETPRARGPYRSADHAGTADYTKHRKKRVALFCALGLTFGCGHFYAQDYKRGAFLALSQIAAIFAMANGLPFALFAFLATIGLDAFGCVAAIDRHNGERPGRLTTLAGRAAFLPLLSLAIVPGLRLAAPGLLIGPSGRSACDGIERCGGSVEQCERALARRASRSSLDFDRLRDCNRCMQLAEQRQLNCEAPFPAPAEPRNEPMSELDTTDLFEPRFDMNPMDIGFGPPTPRLVGVPRACFDPCSGAL